jgi:hypothetical protein
MTEEICLRKHQILKLLRYVIHHDTSWIREPVQELKVGLTSGTCSRSNYQLIIPKQKLQQSPVLPWKVYAKDKSDTSVED